MLVAGARHLRKSGLQTRFGVDEEVRLGRDRFAGLLLNLRCLAYGVVMAPALRGPRWKRALWSQVMVDQPAALGAAQSDPELARYAYVVCGAYLFVFWNLATVVGAIALPILIFLIKVGWPRVKAYFNQGLEDLEGERNNAVQ